MWILGSVVIKIWYRSKGKCLKRGMQLWNQGNSAFMIILIPIKFGSFKKWEPVSTLRITGNAEE